MAATPLASMSKSSRLSASRSSSSPALGFGAAFLGAAAFFAFFFCGPFGPLFEPQLGGVQAASSSATRRRGSTRARLPFAFGRRSDSSKRQLSEPEPSR